VIPRSSLHVDSHAVLPKRKAKEEKGIDLSFKKVAKSRSKAETLESCPLFTFWERSKRGGEEGAVCPISMLIDVRRLMRGQEFDDEQL